jgi:topoisomerase-4 subunit B
MITLFIEETGEKHEWQFEFGLRDYLTEALAGRPTVFGSPFTGDISAEEATVAWAVDWTEERQTNACESYVNLIPTPLGGTHVNGFRSGLLESIREFCRFRDILPKGVSLAPEDIWENIAFILSVKLVDAQFTGQTKERLSSRHCTVIVNSAVKDAFSLWLNQNTDVGERLAHLAVENAQDRLKKARKVTGNGSPTARPFRESSATAPAATLKKANSSLWRVILQVDLPNRQGTEGSRPSCPLRAKFLTPGTRTLHRF